MCSVAESDYEESRLCMKAKQSQPLVGASCKKCLSQKAVVVLRAKDAYCRECFLSSVTHKFRATLGKSRMLKTDEKVLIGISGSQASFALLNLVKEGLEMTNQKRLRCIPYAVYIDEGAILGQTEDERKTLCNAVCRLLEQTGFPVFVSALEHVNNENEYIYHSFDECMTFCADKSALHLLFENVKTYSAKEDLLEKLRHKLLVCIAEKLKCSKIFVGDTSTDLAVKIISNLALGRGAQLPLDIGFCDSRYETVNIIRPLRDLSRKEIAMYNHFNDIQSVFVPSLSTKADPHVSIQKLTEKFVVDLQTEFPSTVSTIFRTGDKLCLEGGGGSHGEMCVLCQAPLDTSQQPSSALQATKFSHMVSLLGPSNYRDLTDDETEAEALNSEECVGSSESDCCSIEKTNCSCLRTERQITRSQLVKCLCYGCRLIVKEMESVDSLPARVLYAARDSSIRNQMRNEIKDFLL